VDREQDFLNYVALHDYRRAIELALSMSQPGRLFSLFKDIGSENQPASFTGNGSVDEVIRTLAGRDLVRLLAYIRDWNANAKTSFVAQRVLFAIFKLRAVDDVMQAFVDEPVGYELTSGKPTVGGDKQGSREALKELLDALIPYSERHLLRMTKLHQESYVLDYILGEMDDGLFDGDLDSDSMQMD
jgi:U3 small nucleolar RNA-associated protein 13